VIEAAYTVLREMVLRSDDDDAPRRLARLGAAHRTLSDPDRRAALDRARVVTRRRDALPEAPPAG
jgi:curved DNA-binding protein CbpA